MSGSHAGPPGPPSDTPVPEPSYAERARTLVEAGRTGTLSTLSRRHAGHPFGSVMPYAVRPSGDPLFLISSMAMHTQNLESDDRASLLVTARDSADDPLAAARVTLVGRAARVAAADVDGARRQYLDRHPRAAAWVDFDDFAFWRLEVAEAYFVGGFAAMDWIGAAELQAAEPDPLGGVETAIVEHMNRDHADALVTYARVLANEVADEATMLSVDRLGFRLRLRAGDRLHGCRIAFPREVRSADEARAAMIEMLRACRAGRPAPP